MYEKFEKQIDTILEKHKGSIKKVELKDIKTLEKLTGQLKSVVDKLDDSKIKSELTDYEKFNQNEKIASENLEKEFNNFKALEKRVEEIEKEKKSTKKEYDKKEKVYDKARDKKETMAMKVFRANDKYMANWKKGESISDNLEEAIFEVKEGAKKLGVKIKVSQYQAQVDKFYNNERDPLSKLDFDY